MGFDDSIESHLTKCQMFCMFSPFCAGFVTYLISQGTS